MATGSDVARNRRRRPTPLTLPIAGRSARRSSARREAEDQLCGLDGDIELWAVADALKLDPVGVGQPVVAQSRGGGRPRQQLVVCAPHDPYRAADVLRVERPALAQRVVDQCQRRSAARHAEHLVDEQLDWDVLEVRDEGRRRDAVHRQSPGPLRRAARSSSPARAAPTGSSACPLYDSSPCAQPPAGASATTVSARPRAASCSETLPPSELPTMCAVAKPASSIACSTASAHTASLISPTIGGPPACPASVGASTS
jgi:hypothetical protein